MFLCEGFSLVAASGGHSSSRCTGLSLSRPLPLRSTGSRRAGSAIVAHGPSCSVACGILPDQGSNPCPLHWQADSQPLRHQGSPSSLFLMWLLENFQLHSRLALYFYWTALVWPPLATAVLHCAFSPMAGPRALQTSQRKLEICPESLLPSTFVSHSTWSTFLPKHFVPGRRPFSLVCWTVSP